MDGAEAPVEPRLVGTLALGEALGERPAVPVGGPVEVAQLRIGAAHGFHGAAGGVRILRGPSGVQRRPVAGQRLAGTAGAGVQIGEVEEGGRPLPGQIAPLRDGQHQAVQPVELGRGRLGAFVYGQRPHQCGHQPPCQGVEFAVLDGDPGGGDQCGPADPQPGGRRLGAGEPQGARQPGELAPGRGALRFGDRAAGLEQAHGALQHPGLRELDLGRAVQVLKQRPQQRREAARHLVLRLLGPVAAQQPQAHEVVEGGPGGRDGTAA